MAIYSGFTHWKWWVSIAMLNYQRINGTWLGLPQSSVIFATVSRRHHPLLHHSSYITSRLSSRFAFINQKVSEVAPHRSEPYVPDGLNCWRGLCELFGQGKRKDLLSPFGTHHTGRALESGRCCQANGLVDPWLCGCWHCDSVNPRQDEDFAEFAWWASREGVVSTTSWQFIYLW